MEQARARIPSEHTLNGERQDVEVQFSYSGGLTLSVFYEIGGETDDRIIAAILKAQTPPLQDELAEFDFTNFVYYVGSETFPECAEEVPYIVLNDYIRPIS